MSFKTNPIVRVKALEWVETVGRDCIAYAEFGGRYSIQVYEGMDTPAKLETHGWYAGPPNGRYGSLEAAKAAAQADYEKRVLSRLDIETPEATS